jgi:quercetin dioxygenase-like cupin family protein
MPLIKASAAPAFELPGLKVVGLAAPSRGAAETCVWQITVPPGTSGPPHTLDREEIFVGLSGEARVALDGADHVVANGDALVVPSGHPFALSNPGPEPFTALVVLPVGGRAAFPGGDRFSPPWTI